MNKLIRTLIALASLGFIASTAHAEPAFKPVVVDLSKVFEKYYKTEELSVKLHETGQKIQDQLDAASKQFQDLATQYQELVEQSKNTMLTPEARAKVEADAQKKGEEAQRLQTEVQDFRNKSQNQMQQQFKTNRDGLLEEISIVVKKIAHTKGATLVLDKSMSPGTGVAGVIYSDDSYDITDEVIKEVNKDRPPAPAVVATPAPKAPATTPTPAPVPAPAKP